MCFGFSLWLWCTGGYGLKMTTEIEKCRAAQRELIELYGPCNAVQINQVGHMDWLIEELILMEANGYFNRSDGS